MIDDKGNKQFGPSILPTDIVLHPSWWYHNEGITFDEDFYFHPQKRVETEQKMEKVLFERWGKYGAGKMHPEREPVMGPVHLAAGFILQEMLGCTVEYPEDSAPQVIPAQIDSLSIDTDAPFRSPVFKRFTTMTEILKNEFGYLTGDINWSGVLNIALDLRGEKLFMDIFDREETVKQYLKNIASVIERFLLWIEEETGTTSISVNRNIRNVEPSLMLHSECSHTMISEDMYRDFIYPLDVSWSNTHESFGIHYCGNDPHRFADAFSTIPGLDFLDAGWGGDIKKLRESLPGVFLNIRLSPVKMITMSKREIEDTIAKLVEDSGDPRLTGICCINMDHHVTDEKIDAIFEVTQELRTQFLS